VKRIQVALFLSVGLVAWIQVYLHVHAQASGQGRFKQFADRFAGEVVYGQ